MTLVFDTNVLLSALFFKSGLSASILSHAISTDQLFTSEWMLGELTDKLNSPSFCRKNRNYQFDEAIIQQISDFARRAFILVVPTNPLPTLCRDPDDNHILQLAEFVGADYLITGDKDLLILDPFETCRIVSPTGFAEQIGIR